MNQEKATPAVPDPGNPYAGLIRWVAYSLFMAGLLVWFNHTWQLIPLSLLAGHFSSQLNAIANK